MNRREFLDFSWKAALGTLAAGCGVPPIGEPTQSFGATATDSLIAPTLPLTTGTPAGPPATEVAAEGPAATATESLLPADRLVERVRGMTTPELTNRAEVGGVSLEWMLSREFSLISAFSVDEQALQEALSYTVGRMLRWYGIYGPSGELRRSLSEVASVGNGPAENALLWELIAAGNKWLTQNHGVPAPAFSGTVQTDLFDYEVVADGLPPAYRSVEGSIPARQLSGISVAIISEEEFNSVKTGLKEGEVPHTFIIRRLTPYVSDPIDHLVFIDGKGVLHLVGHNEYIYRQIASGTVDADSIVGSFFSWFMEALQTETHEKSFGWSDGFTQIFYGTPYGRTLLPENRRFSISTLSDN